MKRSITLTTLGLASSLVLADCRTSGEESTGAAAEASTSALAGAETTSTSPSSAAGVQVSVEHNDADTMFAQMMIPHHEQAVTMTEALLAKECIPGQVRELVEGVIAAQGPEIERTQQMVQTWGEPISTESEGRDHGSMDRGAESRAESGAEMGGMMSEEDTAPFEGARGTEAARLYLEQMTTHPPGRGRDGPGRGRQRHPPRGPRAG